MDTITSWAMTRCRLAILHLWLILKAAFQIGLLIMCLLKEQMTRENRESQLDLHWPQAVAGDMWPVAGAHHGDLRPRHPGPWGKEQWQVWEAGGPRPWLTSSQALWLWKSRGKEKKLLYFHLLKYGSLHHGKLSNPLNVTGRADRNLTALTPNLHLGCHESHLSLGGFKFLPKWNRLLCKNMQTFLLARMGFSQTQSVFKKLCFSNSDNYQCSTLKASEPL